MFRMFRRRHLFVLVVSLVAALSVLPIGSAEPASDVTTVASKLDNPRGLAFAPDGSLYVAEAGRGGSEVCFPAEEGESCFGTSGAVTKIASGHQSRVLTGLPSVAAPDGSSALGPSDVSFRPNGDMYVTFGLGADPALRTELPALRFMGKLVRGFPAQDSWSKFADIAGFEAAVNPDGGALDSNPNSVFATADGKAVVDAGGNALLWVDPQGAVSTLAVFPDRLVDAPPFLGLPPGEQVPMQAVPTSVVKGPDGAFYVGQLTGFPFPVGEAKVYRVDPGHGPEVFAAGFTNIVDVAFGADGLLYVLEIAHNGLLSNDQTGALIRVNADGSHTVLMEAGLTNPGGLTIHDGAAYVSNCGVCPGAGTILKIKLG
jgi:sugar lactone lactonase YvrE